jgi:hypothetical protein
MSLKSKKPNQTQIEKNSEKKSSQTEKTPEKTKPNRFEPVFVLKNKSNQNRPV